MTPAAVHAARTQLGMTQAELARALRLSDPDENGRRTVRNWEKGATPISGPASVAIEFMLVADHCRKTGKGVWADDQPENGN